MSEIVIEEAKRCLNCKKPMCKEGCPVNTPINEVIQMFLSGNIMEAGEKLFENNPLSIVCSLVCPHEDQCEGHCVLGRKGSPVKVGSIENYISEYYIKFIDNKPIKSINKKIAIIGSGPAGICIAIMLAAKGYDITIFEAHDNIGGVLRYGIPEFRLPKSILEKLKEKLISMGIKIRPNILIGSVITVDDIFRDGYKAIFIGTGVWRPRPLGIKGETFGNVHYAIDYLKNPESYKLGDRVCVIGAGNVAMDVARTAIRNGSRNVSIMYRGGLNNISAKELEVEYAKIDGVKFELFKKPTEIVDEGVKYTRTESVKVDEEKEKIVEIEGSEDIFEVDSVIIAIGQGPRANIVSNTRGIDVNGFGLIEADEFGRTTREGVFASGDVVTGAKTVVEAVRTSKKVAQAIDEYVTSCSN
ncbi:NAD(P)-dependent oxidoreductase [Clostridium magnum]|uniref:Glutamate synthase [NADPH] small chain n=1 Tax=Clostridium magnum DSM 2767 TaxID=1121326 RepID=A0A161XGC8_9CLOT|nr:NAD(P)-dependent oxidoreductase [Clostridium magnum]KZL93646.1 glutamate synthase [NADPH] small chain [Clostridium magnum DSM 2767]SHI94129.1 glutamate synthase (NADPH/NADH) small chain [Clostridium magnum DSM 2767]